MKIFKLNLFSAILKGCVFVSIGALAITKSVDFLFFCLFALLFIQTIDIIFTIGRLTVKDSFGKDEYIKIILDIIAFVFLLFLFLKAVNDRNISSFTNSVFYSFIYKTTIILFFGSPIVFSTVLSIRLFRKKDPLAYILISQVIYSCLLAFFVAFSINSTVEYYLLIGLFSICFGIVLILNSYYIYQVNKKGNNQLFL